MRKILEKTPKPEKHYSFLVTKPQKNCIDFLKNSCRDKYTVRPVVQFLIVFSMRGLHEKSGCFACACFCEGYDIFMFFSMCVGGMDIRPQIKKLSRAHQFVIATPGRALDLIKKRFILAEKFNTVVLDEADRMLDMGFITDMRKILEKTPETRETLLFSATMNQASEKLADDFLKNPVTVSVKKTDVTQNIEQTIVHYQNNNKFDTLLDLLKDKDFKRVLVFGSRKHSAQKLAEQLNDNKIPTESIHGNKSHNHRQRALQNFKDGTHKVIVATDVVARGIHVNNISHVINYDLPNTADDYIHRIGRTGRAGQKGKAITFIQSRG